MAENFSISDRASMIPLGFDSPPPLVITTVPLPPGMDVSFLPEPQESQDRGPVGHCDRYYKVCKADLEPLPAHAEPEGEEEERGRKKSRPESLKDGGKERPPEGLVSLVRKIFERVQKFQEVHDRHPLSHSSPDI